MNVVIGLSGRINSGKSTLADQLSASLDCNKTSFSDIVREDAINRKMELSRDSLQKIGQELVDLSCEEFCKRVLKKGNWNVDSMLVVEGIRPLKIVESLIPKS